MRYLAQVCRQDPSSEVQLRLLAAQKSEHFWTLITKKEEFIPCADFPFCQNDDVLVMVELSEARQVLSIQSAVPWVLDMVDQYLSSGLSPAALKQEVELAEQWRQSLTLRSQELGRQAVEIEARRGQIEDLETKLIEEKKQLEAIAHQMRANATSSEQTPVEAARSSDD